MICASRPYRRVRWCSLTAEWYVALVSMSMAEKGSRGATLFVVAAAMLLSLHFFRPVHGGLWLTTFYNFLHFPVFGVVALAIFGITGVFFKRQPWQRVVIAGIVMFIVSILSEAAQIPGPRDASLDDLISNWFGAASFLLIAVAVSFQNHLSKKGRGLCGIGGTILLLIASWHLITVTAVYLERNARIPVLATFDSWLGSRLVLKQNAQVTLVKLDTDERTWAQVTLDDGNWPGLVFHDLWPDWSSYEALVLELKPTDDRPLEINIRVHDRQHTRYGQPYSDRFNMHITLEKEGRIVRIPLDDIAEAPGSRAMNMTRIAGLVIFCSRDKAGRAFLLTDIRLE